MFICRSHNSQCVQTLSDATDSITSLCVDDVSIVTGYVFLYCWLRRSVDGSIRTYDIRAGKLYEEKIGSSAHDVS